jgi:hypothetical protein
MLRRFPSESRNHAPFSPSTRPMPFSLVEKLGKSYCWKVTPIARISSVICSMSSTIHPIKVCCADAGV